MASAASTDSEDSRRSVRACIGGVKRAGFEFECGVGDEFDGSEKSSEM